jgi:hypothetical protein
VCVKKLYIIMYIIYKISVASDNILTVGGGKGVGQIADRHIGHVLFPLSCHLLIHSVQKTCLHRRVRCLTDGMYCIHTAHSMTGPGVVLVFSGRTCTPHNHTPLDFT